MIKVERSYPAPESLSLQKSYTERDVIERLKIDFYDKCYICGLNDLPDINVEHLLPHKNGKYPERKFDWENLFLSCPHCNGIKNKKEYDEMIIDCCKIDPEEKINFNFNGEDIEVSAKDLNDLQAVRTAELIYDVFNLKNTGIREYTSDFRFKKLQEEMTIFFENLRKYKSEKLAFKIVKSKLRKESRFAEFKRFYVRKNIDSYPELYEIIK